MANKPYRETELTLKNILSKHDTLDANRLSREGFLSYYREVAATDPRQVGYEHQEHEGVFFCFVFSFHRSDGYVPPTN